MERPRTRYLIAGMQRSGTTLVHVCLHGHPYVSAMHDEVAIDPFFTKGVGVFTIGGRNLWEREHWSSNLFDAATYFTHGYPRDLPKQEILAHGMKIATSNAEQVQQLLDALRLYHKDLSIIHVRRADWLAQFASLKLAGQTGKWHSWTPTDAGGGGEPPRFPLDLDEFRTYMRNAAEIDRLLGSLRDSHPFLGLSYEEDIAQQRDTWHERVFDFLGIPKMKPEWLSSKKVSPKVDEFVANADDARAAMAAFRASL